MENIAYDVPGMDQEGAQLLEKRLEKLPGVQDVTVWIGEQSINVYYDPALVSPRDLAKAMRDLGYWPKFVPRMQRWPGR